MRSRQLQLEDLRSIIWRCPVIDNHGHNILRPQPLREHDLLTITTEASGEAIATSSLPHLRAVKQLRQLYKLDGSANWAAVQARRLEPLGDELTKRCLEGTQTILIDDGLGDPDSLESYDWHSQFTSSPCKRIIRIETVAADILSGMYQQGQLPIGVAIASEGTSAWAVFMRIFEANMTNCLADDEVVGFKSVICYRSGLDIDVSTTEEQAISAFEKHFLPSCKVKSFRIAQKRINDALVLSLARLLANHLRQTKRTKPVQFHTGLGDNDINLLKSNPACMQPFIEAFPTVPIVLLHSAYPYTREAGYLSTVYSNVYLDIGEVFPMVSRAGQEKILEQALESTPTTRILWSTDGHYLPETYYLANQQGRQALQIVFESYVSRGDLDAAEAAQAVCDILYNNSNQLYNLKLPPYLAAALLGTDGPQVSTKAIESAQSTPSKPVPNTGRVITPGPSSQNMVSLDTSIELYFVQWIDYLGTLRARCIPSKEFHRLAVANELRFSISSGNLGTLQNDHVTPAVHAIGQLFVHPDLTSLKPMTRYGKVKTNAATIMSSFYTEEREPHHMCPRRTLSSLLSKLKHDWQLSMRIGFEIECVIYNDDGPITNNHAWSTFTAEQYAEGFGLLVKIQKALQQIGIHLQQMHAESGPGQYEFVLPPAHPINAIDALYQARQCIEQIVSSEGLQVTFHAMPFGIGNASHVHMSFRSAADDLEVRQRSFMAGLLDHLPAVCAFTMPERPSYARVKDDAWTGGTWVAWGTQNREVPLRRIASEGKSQRWELRCIDGMPNAYLALSAIIAAGMCGLADQSQLSQDIQENPARLSSSERSALGIVERLPRSLDESLTALKADTGLMQILPHVIEHYCVIKDAEQDFLDDMSEEEQRKWLVDKY